METKEKQQPPDKAGMQIMPTMSALEAIERSNIDMQIATAKKYPRHLSEVKKRMMDLATLDQETAASCFYKLNRAGKNIEGPSVRMAEIAFSCWGNIRCGQRVVANDGKAVTGQAFAHDLETNAFEQVEVQRRITDRNGVKYSDDMQIVTGNAAAAIAFRNAVFKVVPFALVKPIYLAAKKTAVGDLKTLKARREDMLEKFKIMGVNERRICANLNRKGIEEIGLDDLETLIGLYNAIRDGDESIDECFPVVSIQQANVPETPPPASNGGAASTSKETSPPTPTTQPASKAAPPQPPAAPPTTRKRASRLKAKTQEPAPPPQERSPFDAELKPNRAALQKLLAQGGYNEIQFLEVCNKNEWLGKGRKWDSMNDVSDDMLEVFLDAEEFAVVAEQLEKLPRHTKD